MDAGTIRVSLLAASAGIAGFVVYRLAKSAGAAIDAAGNVVGTAAKAADTAIAAPVLAAGDVLGIPRTNMTECEKAMADGRTWDASFACPAGDFLAYLARGKPAATTPTAPVQPTVDGSSIGGNVSFSEASKPGWNWAGAMWGQP